LIQYIITTLLFILLIVLYYIAGFKISKCINYYLNIKNDIIKSFLISFIYAIILGIGFIGGGDDPYFVFPLPFVFASIYFIWKTEYGNPFL
jgi:hypothetical protein